VVAYHLNVLPFRQAGVDVFFVISGFIMACVAPYEGRDFLVKRLIRIVPLYWVTRSASTRSRYFALTG